MTTILTINPSRAIDLNGFSLPSARATFTNSGTTRRRTVYADADCTIPHPSPLVADGAGVFPPIYDTGDGNAAVTVTDASGAVLAGFPIDPVPAVSTDQTGASGIGFDPTPEIPVKTVQAAIERVQANMAQPLLDYGLGVSGAGPLISNIDDATTPSGVYRFNGTTSGTFPNGVTAAAGGTVEIWRSTANAALMTITQAGARRQNVRSHASGAWGGWTYIMQSSDTATDAVWAAGTSTVPAIPSPKGIKAAVAGALSAGGSAPVFAPRAWIAFNGTNANIFSQGNVSKVERNGVGDYTMTFASAMPHANYAIIGSVRDGGGGIATVALRDGHTKTTSAVRFQTRYSTSGSDGPTDCSLVSVVVIC